MRSREVATGDTIVVVSADSRGTIATVTVPAAPIEDDAGVVAWPPQSLSVAVPVPDMTPEVRVRVCVRAFCWRFLPGSRLLLLSFH